MSMRKIITSHVDYGITILGSYIPPSGVIELERQFHRHFAANPVHYENLVSSGILSINNGVRDLPTSGALEVSGVLAASGNVANDFMKQTGEGSDVYFRNDADKGNLFTSHDVQSAIEEAPPDIELNDESVVRDSRVINFEGDVNVVHEGDRKVTVDVGHAPYANGRYKEVMYGAMGTSPNKWIDLYSHSVSSNDIQYIHTRNCELTGYWVNNINVDAEFTIQLFNNGLAPGNKVYEVSVDGKKWQYDNCVTPVSFSIGDQMSCFIKDDGQDPRDILVIFEFQILESDCASDSGTS